MNLLVFGLRFLSGKKALGYFSPFFSSHNCSSKIVTRKFCRQIKLAILFSSDVTHRRVHTWGCRGEGGVWQTSMGRIGSTCHADRWGRGWGEGTNDGVACFYLVVIWSPSSLPPPRKMLGELSTLTTRARENIYPANGG